MKIDLYKNTSSENTMNKTITDKKTFEGTLKNTIDIANFSVIFNFFDDWNNYNYVYIEKFNRYYFVENKKIFNNSLVQYDLIEDVLMSFKDVIENNILTMTESDRYVENGRGDYEGKNESVLVNSYDFNDVFDGDSGVLVTVKGA